MAAICISPRDMSLLDFTPSYSVDATLRLMMIIATTKMNLMTTTGY
jgi:hypothetical protein